MKKITRGFAKIIYNILSFFDRWLITPITKLILRITDFFKKNSPHYRTHTFIYWPHKATRRYPT